MPDFGSPVAVNVDVNPNRGIQTLSGILGLKAQQQGLAGQAAQVQMEQQSAQQRAGIAQWMTQFDPTQHVGADGTLDLDNVLTDPKLRAAAGDQFPQLVQQMIQVKQGQLYAKTQLAQLNDTLRTQFQDSIGGLRTDPDVIAGNDAGFEKVNRAIGQFAATSPDAQRIANIYSSVAGKTPRGPAQGQGRMSPLQQFVSNTQLQAMAAGSQAGAQAPAFASAGNRLVPIAPQAAPSAPIGVGTPPQWQYDPVTKSYHPVQALGPGGGATAPANSQPPTPQAPPATPQQPPAATAARPTVAGAPQYRPGEADTMAANTEAGGHRYNALVAASTDSPARVNVLDNIIRIAGAPTPPRTGVGGGWKAAYETALGQTPGFAAAADDASAYNQLVKYLEQNSLRSWQAAGGTGTNQQLSSIEAANPNVKQDPRTMVELAKFNKAGELALQAKMSAHQAWLHQPGNNFLNQSDFENEWRQHFDPVLFQLKTWGPDEARQRLGALNQQQIDKLASEQDYMKRLGVY